MVCVVDCQVSVVSFWSKLCLGLLTIPVFLSLAGTVRAQHLAVEGEYIITPRMMSVYSSESARAATLARQGAQEIGVVARSLVVRDSKRAVSANSQQRIAPVQEDDQFCVEMIKSGVARDCSPNYILSISTTPDDLSYSNLWGMSAESGINAPGAWEINTGSEAVVVAVIDTGINYSHPDLAANVWINPNEIAANGIDDDGNGVIDDLYGYNAILNSGNPNDDNGHGSHVAGTIGATGNNGVGVVGVNWNVKLMGLKFLDSKGSGNLASAIKAIDYMIAMKQRGVNIRVSNNSWGGGGYSQPLYEAIARARDAGILFVAAAGNEGKDIDAVPSYPASYDLENIISVGAFDKFGNLATFSNYGPGRVHIGAPGVNILSTVLNAGYGSLSGTSMAAPHVSGALALLLANEPGIDNSAAKARLTATGVSSLQLQGVIANARKLNVNNLVKNLEQPYLTEPEPSNCSYQLLESNLLPSASAATAPLILQADEFNYKALDLPFAFPFFDKNVSRVWISPNGVVYADSAPSGMDYQTSTRAPINSIAALHTDLVATVDPNGVRVESSSNAVTIYYRAGYYGQTTPGYAEVWLTLYPDGTIDKHLEFSNAATEAALQARATIGITGNLGSSAVTYAYRNNKIVNGAGIRYLATCGADAIEQPQQISSVGVRGVDRRGKPYKYVVPGAGVEFLVQAAATGTVELVPVLDGKRCTNALSVMVSPGENSFASKLPRQVKKRFGLEVIQPDLAAPIAKARAAVKSRFGKGAKNLNAKRATTRARQRGCDQFISKLGAS